jgi:hypothetical protein
MNEQSEMWEPDELSSVEVTIEAPERTRVGVPVRLNAWRRSGPWRKAGAGGDAGRVRLSNPPPASNPSLTAFPARAPSSVVVIMVGP